MNSESLFIRLWRVVRANFFHYWHKFFPKKETLSAKGGLSCPDYSTPQRPLSQDERDSLIRLIRAQRQCDEDALLRLRLQSMQARQNLSVSFDLQRQSQGKPLLPGLSSGLFGNLFGNLFPFL